jgi:AcrR family transcriptional regulator
MSLVKKESEAMTTVRIRNYAGHSADERRLARRERLIEGAIRAYGEMGYRNTTVKAVCEAAGLTERYFYESFENSEALLIAAFDTISRRLFAYLEEIRRGSSSGTPDERCLAVLRAYYQALKDDPGAARVFVVEIARVGPSVDDVWAGLLHEFSELLWRTVVTDGNVRRAPSELLRAGVVGAVVQIAKVWIRSGFARRVGAVAADALRICRVLEK